MYRKAGRARARPRSPGPLGVRRIFGDGGFAPLEALPRRVAPLMLQFPPCGGGKVVVRGGVVAVRGGVAPKVRRPPRRKTPTMGCRGRGGLRFGQNCLGHGVLFAREPAIACANRLYRT